MVVRPLLASACVLVLLSGCMNVGVSNQTNAFSYGGQVSDKSTTESYTWENTIGKAIISWGGQAASGSVTLTIKDSVGHLVYTKTFDGGNSGFSGNTDRGLPGNWDVSISFQKFTGNMGLSLAATG